MARQGRAVVIAAGADPVCALGAARSHSGIRTAMSKGSDMPAQQEGRTSRGTRKLPPSTQAAPAILPRALRNASAPGREFGVPAHWR